MRQLKASEFKAKCLKLIDEVNESGEPIEITKRGRVVARLMPMSVAGEALFGRGRNELRLADPDDDMIGILEPADIAAWYSGDADTNASAEPEAAPSRRRRRQV